MLLLCYCNFWEKYVLPIFAAAHRHPLSSTHEVCEKGIALPMATDRWNHRLIRIPRVHCVRSRKIHFFGPWKKETDQTHYTRKIRKTEQPVPRNDSILADGDGIAYNHTNYDRPSPRIQTAAGPSSWAIGCPAPLHHFPAPWQCHLHGTGASVGGFSRKNGSRNLVVAMRWGSWVRNVRRSTTEDRRAGGFPLPRYGPRHVLGLRH